MKTILFKTILATNALALLFLVSALNAQTPLDRIFGDDIFHKILGDQDNPEEGKLEFNPEQANDHRRHYIPSSRAADSILVPNLKRLIAGNISSFPVSSTAVGVSFDFSSGRPVSISESLGPIFAETGRTLGKGRVNIGMNYNFLDLTKFRGIRTKDIRFTFVHEDVNKNSPDNQGLGDLQPESDLLDIFLDLNVNANIFAFYATIGILDNLDLGIALPVVNISINGEAEAVIRSFTHTATGQAEHHFGGDIHKDPVLIFNQPYSGDAFGIGDLIARLKYAVLTESEIDIAALLDVKLPTGKEEDFLGTGETNVRLTGIMSAKLDNTTPHLNIGYDYRRGKFDSDELEFAIGLDHKLARGVTLALDLLGQIDLFKKDALKFEYNDTPLEVTYLPTSGGERTETIDQTNIPIRDYDHILNAAVGFRYAPSDNFILLSNFLLPVNDGGLRANVAYTIGFAASF